MQLYRAHVVHMSFLTDSAFLFFGPEHSIYGQFVASTTAFVKIPEQQIPAQDAQHAEHIHTDLLFWLSVHGWPDRWRGEQSAQRRTPL